MATFKVAPETSIFTTSITDHAFDADTAGADALTVDAGAFLITAGIIAIGAFLRNTGAWKVTVNGTIVGNQYIASRSTCATPRPRDRPDHRRRHERRQEGRFSVETIDPYHLLILSAADFVL